MTKNNHYFSTLNQTLEHEVSHIYHYAMFVICVKMAHSCSKIHQTQLVQ